MPRKRTKEVGVYARVSQIRMVGRKPDICYDISYRDKSGRKRWEKVGWTSEGYTPKLAAQIRAERLRSIRHGQELPREKKRIPLFSEMAELYLAWAAENKSRVVDDMGRYENHLKDSLGHKHLNDISSFDLERLKSDLMKKELAPATVKHCLILVRQIFNKAREWGKYSGDHPLKGVKLPTLNNKRERFFTYEEADLLLKELAKVSNCATHDQGLLALHCGLRPGEIFNLKGQDLDFTNGLIRIMDPKNKANRTAYMTNAVRELLIKRIPENPGDFIFKERETGGKIKVVSQTFDKAVDRLGFNKGVEDRRQKVVFYTLRHTFASWLAIDGVPILTIKELMGHKTLFMTERYAHLSPDVKKSAALALEGNFEASRNGRKVIPVAAAKGNPVAQ